MKTLLTVFRVLFLAVVVLLSSCEKEIDFEYHPIPAEPVIEGWLTEAGASVRLTQTVATDEPFSPPLSVGATAVITDVTTGLSYLLEPDSARLFTSHTLRGEAGHTYSLRVEMADKIYTCESTMLESIEMVGAEFNWIRMPYDDVAVLKVTFTASDNPLTAYWMRVYRNGEIYQWQVVDGRSVTGGLATGMLMTSRRDLSQEDEEDILRPGDRVDIEVMPISALMSDYLASLNNGDYNGLRLFSGPPCLGFFLAAPVARTSLLYDPDSIPYAR